MEYNSLGQPVIRTTSSGGSLPTSSTTAWGEPYAIPITPVIQFDAAYGVTPLTDENVIDTVTEGAGTVTGVDGTITCTSGTTAGDTAAFYSVRHIPYRTGQGCLARFTAAFTTGVANSQQRAGMSNGGNYYMFGYVNDTFGIVHAYNGESEIRTLTITGAASGSETATITLDGTAYTVDLTAGTTTHNAAQIFRDPDFNIDGQQWRVDQIDNTVVFTSRSTRPMTGTFSFSSSTATGTFAQNNAGVSPTLDLIDTTEWDNLPDNFDPTNLNVYQIQMKWLGAGAVYFSVEDPNTGDFTLVHTKKWVSTGNTFPHTSKPNMKLGFAAAATGSLASSMVVKMASAMGAVEGTITQNNYSLSAINTDTTNRASGSVWHTLSVRNPWEKYDRYNTHEVILQRCDFAYQGNDPLLVYLFVNSRASTPLQFTNLNNAKVLISQSLGTTISTASYTPAVTFSVPINGSGSIDLTPYRLILPPGQEVNVAFLSNGQVTRTTTALTFGINS